MKDILAKKIDGLLVALLISCMLTFTVSTSKAQAQEDKKDMVTLVFHLK